MIAASPARLDGMWVLRPELRTDDRGFFMRVFSGDVLEAAGIDPRGFVQENQSRSRHGVLRGLHGSTVPREAKLVRCVRGRIFDVAVDLRPWSPTFLQWESIVLDDEHNVQVYLPAGFAHGFTVVSGTADVTYRVDAWYDPDLELTLAWDDPELAIPWPVSRPITSARDRAGLPLSEVRSIVEDWRPLTRVGA